jgi:formylglycine-generating enzyme required for sulfatase activity
MKKILLIASIVVGALMAKAADDRHSVTIGNDHLANITAVVKTSPTTVIIRSDGRLMQVEVKALSKPFLNAWNISTEEKSAAENGGTAPSGSNYDFQPGRNHMTILSSDVTLDLVWIPPGTFTMGSPRSEVGSEGDHQEWEGPQTVVTISKGFWLGKTLVTQKQYKAVTGHKPGDQGHFVGEDFTNIGPNAPMEAVSWDDAMAFCQKLTDQERAAGHLPEDLIFTLPTEAQWEYACRAGTTGARYGNLDYIAWYAGNSGNTTHPVARKQPNAWGLYDMLGNVFEWCSDWYYIRHPGGKVTDPVGPLGGDDHVIRGGSWLTPADDCRSAYRDIGHGGWGRYNFIGFRLALVPTR